jgi:hypothetical protein
MELTEIGAVGGSRVFRVSEGIYLVRLSGHLSRVDSDTISDLVAGDNKHERRAVLYEVTPGFSGYDPELRKLGTDNPALRGMTHIGIITSNTMLRMVAATVALGLRAAKGIPMNTYANVEAAVAGARSAMAKAQ